MENDDNELNDVCEFLENLRENSIDVVIDRNYAKLSLHQFVVLFPNVEYPRIGQEFNSGIVIYIAEHIFISKTGEIELDITVEYPPPDYCVSLTFYSELVDQHIPTVDKIFELDQPPEIRNNFNWWEENDD
jgi:hypothetical protein